MQKRAQDPFNLTPHSFTNNDHHRFSVAPMLDWTDKHCRYFHRLLTKKSLIYTEMVTMGAILHGRGDYLTYNEEEHPLALQLGGSSPVELAACAKQAEARGYDEINLNIGCPSDRVKNGQFGVCLMKQADVVVACLSEMNQAVSIPVTVKTRIGVDECDDYDFLAHFIETVSRQCNIFILHARKAWLTGLSPKENRDIPPLNYDRVYRLKQDFPHLTISINGGIKTIEQAKQHLLHVDGVMMGREAYQHPSSLLMVDHLLFNSNTLPLTAIEAIYAYLPYIEKQLSQGVRLNHITRHLLGLFQGINGAKQWRRYLSEHAHLNGAGIEVVEKALTFIE